jgi:hypothetical protein
MRAVETNELSDELLMEGHSGPVGISGQCRDFPGSGLCTNGASDRRNADFAYDGATADDASLGIPLELAGYVNPE